MTITCIVCKKQPIPGDNTRSFHKFPDNKEQKQEWMQATGVSYVSKHTKVCSDHFYLNSFHDTNGYTTKRRLLPNAIPCKRSITSILSNVINKSVVRTTENKRETLQDFTVDQSFSTPTPRCSANASIDKCLNRNLYAIDVKEFELEKNNHFMDGCQATYLSKEDFSTDQSLIKFTKYQRRADHKRKERHDNKIGNVKEPVKSLREENAVAAVNYLERDCAVSMLGIKVEIDCEDAVAKQEPYEEHAHQWQDTMAESDLHVTERDCAASMLAIKEEADCEDAAVKQEPYEGYAHPWEDAMVEPDLHVTEVPSTVLEINGEMDKPTIKQELEVGPTVLQSRNHPFLDTLNIEDHPTDPRPGTSSGSGMTPGPFCSTFARPASAMSAKDDRRKEDSAVPRAAVPAPRPRSAGNARRRASGRRSDDRFADGSVPTRVRESTEGRHESDYRMYTITRGNALINLTRARADGKSYRFSKMPTTNAERCKKYYKRNQTEKRKKTAERVRAYRLRQKIFSEQSGTSAHGPSNVILNSDISVVTSGSSCQQAAISLNEIISNNIFVHVGDNIYDSSLSTPTQDYYGIISVQAEVHIQNFPQLCKPRMKKKAPLTSAERTRRWRAKKKEKQFTEILKL